MCLAIPGQVMEIQGDGLTASGLVRFGEIERRVNLALTPGVSVGDYVLVHVGFSITQIDVDEAQRIYDMLDVGEASIQ